MSTITQQQQTEVDQCAAEYVRLVQVRIDRLEKAIIEAQMWLSLREYTRATGCLFQALNS